MRYLLLFLAVLLAAPVALAQKPSDEDKAADDEGMLGAWEYTVRPDDPMAQGTFELEDAGEQINGMFNTDAPRKMENIEVSESGLSFTFTQPGMGLITIVFAMDGEGLSGTASPEGAEEPLPIIAVRPGADSDSSED